jgi:hypothetical protein
MAAIVLAILLVLSSAGVALAETALVIGCKEGVGWVFGYGTNHPTEESAAQEGMRQCEARGVKCRVRKTMGGGGYMAFAEDAKPCGAYGYGYMATPQEARAKALESCVKSGGASCHITGRWADAGNGEGNTYSGSPGGPSDGLDKGSYCARAGNLPSNQGFCR